MSQLSKSQLQAENQTSFPNNNAGLITPEVLRNFNTDMIDSMVVGLSTGSFATTGSNTFTADQHINGNLYISGTNYIDFNGGLLRIGEASNGVTLIDGIDGIQIRNFGTNDIQIEQNANGAISIDNNSGSVSINAHVNGQSVNISGSYLRLNNVDFIPFSASVNSRILAITGSGGNINTSSFATTGSNSFRGTQQVNGDIIISGSNSNHLLFSRPGGGGDIFRIGISDNGNTYDFTITGSTNQPLWLIDNQGGTYINTFQAPIIAVNNVRLDAGFTASLQNGYVWVGNSSNKTSLFNFNTYSASVDTRINNIVVGSGFATTGSNLFIGNQTISKNGGLFAISDPTNPQFGTASFGMSGASGGLIFRSSGSIVFEGIAGTQNLSFYGTASFNKGLKISDSDVVNGVDLNYNTTTNVLSISRQGADSASLNIEGTLTASLEQGYVWAGGVGNRTRLVATSSFGGGGSVPAGTVSGSQQILNYGIFATTGSNTFQGIQTMNARIISNDELFINNGNSITLAQNLDYSGSQYAQVNIFADVINNPNDIYESFQILKPNQDIIIAIAANSYTAESGYGNGTVGWIGAGGNNANNSNTAMLFRTNSADMEVYKPTRFAYDVTITGSLTASLANGLMYVGGANNITKTISTASFATTGSNTFVGNEIINGTLSISGSGTPLIITGGFKATAASQISGAAATNTLSTITSTISGSLGQSVVGRGYIQSQINTNVIGLYASGSSLVGLNNGAPTGSSGIAIASGSAGSYYYPIQFQPSTGYTDGRVTITTPLAAQNQILYTTGSNKQTGTATLDGGNPGTVTVSNSLVTANSIIMLTKQDNSHNGNVVISAKSAGSFTITSDNNGDNSVVGWMIINNS